MKIEELIEKTKKQIEEMDFIIDNQTNLKDVSKAFFAKKFLKGFLEDLQIIKNKKEQLK